MLRITDRNLQELLCFPRTSQDIPGPHRCMRPAGRRRPRLPDPCEPRSSGWNRNWQRSSLRARARRLFSAGDPEAEDEMGAGDPEAEGEMGAGDPEADDRRRPRLLQKVATARSSIGGAKSPRDSCRQVNTPQRRRLRRARSRLRRSRCRSQQPALSSRSWPTKRRATKRSQ